MNGRQWLLPLYLAGRWPLTAAYTLVLMGAPVMAVNWGAGQLVAQFPDMNQQGGLVELIEYVAVCAVNFIFGW